MTIQSAISRDADDVLATIAAIPIERMRSGGVGTLDDYPHDFPIMAWEGTALTVGHVKAARRVLAGRVQAPISKE